MGNIKNSTLPSNCCHEKLKIMQESVEGLTGENAKEIYVVRCQYCGQAISVIDNTQILNLNNSIAELNSELKKKNNEFNTWQQRVIDINQKN